MRMLQGAPAHVQLLVLENTYCIKRPYIQSLAFYRGVLYEAYVPLASFEYWTRPPKKLMRISPTVWRLDELSLAMEHVRYHARRKNCIRRS